MRTNKQFQEQKAICFISFLVTAVLLYGVTFRNCANEVKAATTNEVDDPRYNPILLPINETRLRDGLVVNSTNAAAEYQLLLRAGFQHEEKVAYNTMNQLRKEQPNNPVALDGYFMALRMAEGGINTTYYNAGRHVISISSQDNTEAEALLQEAYRLNPSLWLTYALDGEDKYLDSEGSRSRGVALLQKAEALGPKIAFVHCLLGGAYMSSPPTAAKCRLYEMECKRALAVDPRASEAASGLFMIYHLWLPNQAEALRWKHRFLSLVPPGAKLNPSFREMLNQCPG